jgi:hypothetical protein
MSATDAVRTKLRETTFHLAKLTGIDSMREFYPTLNAFLSAARSVLYVARLELGWADRRSAQRAGFTPAQQSERERFDAWYASSPEAQAVETHPLTEERHCVIHRGGQAGFFHTPSPIGGLAATDGNAHGPGLVAGGHAAEREC